MGRLGVEAGPMLLTEKLEGFWEIWRQKDRGARVPECLQERMDGCWQLYTGGFWNGRQLEEQEDGLWED